MAQRKKKIKLLSDNVILCRYDNHKITPRLNHCIIDIVNRREENENFLFALEIGSNLY